MRHPTLQSQGYYDITTGLGMLVTHRPKDIKKMNVNIMLILMINILCSRGQKKMTKEYAELWPDNKSRAVSSQHRKTD